MPVYGPGENVSFHQKNFFEPNKKRVTFVDSKFFSYIAENDDVNTNGDFGSKGKETLVVQSNEDNCDEKASEYYKCNTKNL